MQEEIEDKIIDWVALGTSGRLIAFKPERGADLVIQKKGDYSGKKLFLNIKIFITPRGENDFIMDVPQNDYESREGIYLMFVVFDKIKRKIDEKIWLVPALEFSKNANDFKFEPSRFLNYLTNKNKFNLFLIEKLISKNKAVQRKKT